MKQFAGNTSGIAGDDADDFDDNVTLIEAARITREQTFSDYLTSLRNNEGVRQSLEIDRKRILHQCIKLLKQKRLDLRLAPDISFTGEQGIDADGLTREFLTLLMTAIREGEDDITFFEGEFPNLVPIHNTDLISSNMFYYVGQLLAYSFVHGGISLVGISPVIASYVINGEMEAVCDMLSITDIADPTLREILQKVLILIFLS